MIKTIFIDIFGNEANIGDIICTSYMELSKHVMVIGVVESIQKNTMTIRILISECRGLRKNSNHSPRNIHISEENGFYIDNEKLKDLVALEKLQS